MAKELKKAIHERIKNLCAEGDALVEDRKYANAVGKYVDALELLPKPFTDWEAATWIFGSLGEAHFKAKSYEKALSSLANAFYCPDGLGNPFLHLRFGQVNYELGQMDAAADSLARAYMGGGKELFDVENPKYYRFLKTKIAIKDSASRPRAAKKR